MTKQKIIHRMVEELLDKELLNEADAGDIPSLQHEVEELMERHLTDYMLVWKAGILEEE